MLPQEVRVAAKTLCYTASPSPRRLVRDRPLVAASKKTEPNCESGSLPSCDVDNRC